MWFRKMQLERLYSLVKENEERFYKALEQDLNKPRLEAFTGDIAPALDECLYFLENLDTLVKDKTMKPRSLINKSEKVITRRDPLGVVLIIGCWNYPVQLSLVPLAGAIAAGNCAILKPSEVAPHTAALITELFPKYLDSSCYRIVNGGVEESTELLKNPFDHIFYTGNSTVGKIVMEAASKHLTPVTLELGGKSPAIVLEDASIQLTANRIAFGKFYNAGQICIGVDYVLIHKSRLNDFTEAFKKTVHEWYGPNPKESNNYARIVADRHVDRLQAILDNRKSGQVVLGGQIDKKDRYVAPTLVTNVRFDDPSLMSEEIFGPILPVLTFNTLEEAIALVNRKDPPLALYVFTQKKKLAEQVLRNTRSGGVCVNDCLVHQAEYSLPFGGVGTSGMGNYHGEKSFNTFTHERGMIIKKQNKERAVSMRYPPYTDRKLKIISLVLVKHPWLVWLTAYRTPLKLITFILVLLSVVAKMKRA
ncbi:Putative Aldehyde dehydrogenase [Rhizopus microsporus]|nr:Putative Aldehyde dehydrogenase [Rhizopus microsporus]